MFALIPTPIKIYIALGLLALMTALTGGAYVMGRSDGGALKDAKWLAREVEINAAAANAMLEMIGTVRAEERAIALDDAKGSADYQKKLQEKTREQEHVIAGLRDGTAKLYVNTRCPSAGAAGVQSPATGAGGHNGETRTELSKPDAEFLIGESSRADKVVEQLTACQLRLAADRGGVK